MEHNTRPTHVVLLSLSLLFSLFSLSACEPSQEAPRVTLEVWSSEGSLESVVTDLGYEVTLTRAELALKDLRFMVAGEAHLASRPPLWSALLSPVYAHPGHLQGGEVTGALVGELLAVWGEEVGVDRQPLGLAQLITGRYSSAEFTFSRAASPFINATHPLNAHTALLEGVASREGRVVPFKALIDAPENRALTGIPFEATVTTTPNAKLSVELSVSAFAGEHTLFDGLDFEALSALEAEAEAEADEPMLTLSPERLATEAGYFTLRRALMTHDFYRVGYTPTSAALLEPSDEL